MPLPIFPWCSLSLELAVGSSPFLAEGCWFPLGVGRGFPVLCVFVARAGVCGARASVGFVCLLRLCCWWQWWWLSRALVCVRVRVWCVGGAFGCLPPASPG